MRLSVTYGRSIPRPVAREPPKSPPRSAAIQTSLPSSPESAFRKRKREERDSSVASTEMVAKEIQTLKVDFATKIDSSKVPLGTNA